jgi:hypothetical protein
MKAMRFSLRFPIHQEGLSIPEEQVLASGSTMDELTPRDKAIFLLHTAAEIEHALLVQYLYAAYSVRRGMSIPGRDNSHTTTVWRNRILQVAREEMGHLLTVQNILRALGGPLNFEREDFPFRAELYPFPFQLEPLSKNSLAKYVVAEMVSDWDKVLSVEEHEDIWNRALQGTGGEAVNHVGTLYQKVTEIVSSLGPDSFVFESAGYQASAGWKGNTNPSPVDLQGVRVLRVKSQQDILDALSVIARQGEGAGDAPNSHFRIFCDMYREYPDEGWNPAYDMMLNPNTSTAIPPDVQLSEELAADERTRSIGRITNPIAAIWAKLFNVRYRMMLAQLAHALILSEDDTDSNEKRVMLRDWFFCEMVRPPQPMMRIPSILIRMTQHVGTGPNVGATFELPYSLSLPDREQDRWRLHGELINASAALICRLKNEGLQIPFLDELLRYDGENTEQGRRKAIVRFSQL